MHAPIRRLVVVASGLAALLLAAPASGQVVHPSHARDVERVRETATIDELMSEAGILRLLVRVVCALPPDERAGLHAKPAGENIAVYAPANLSVGISRIMYPDGTLIKVFSDAGPRGANGAQWSADGILDADRYVPVACMSSPTDPPAPPSPPVESSALAARVAELAARVTQLGQALDDAGRQLAAAQARIDELSTIATGAAAGVVDVRRFLVDHPTPDGCRTQFLSCRLTFNAK